MKRHSSTRNCPSCLDSTTHRQDDFSRLIYFPFTASIHGQRNGNEHYHPFPSRSERDSHKWSRGLIDTRNENVTVVQATEAIDHSTNTARNTAVWLSSALTSSNDYFSLSQNDSPSTPCTDQQKKEECTPDSKQCQV